MKFPLRQQVFQGIKENQPQHRQQLRLLPAQPVQGGNQQPQLSRVPAAHHQALGSLFLCLFHAGSGQVGEL